MSYDASQLSTSPVYRLRFRLQDHYEEAEWLTDDEYEFLLDSNDDNEDVAVVEAGIRILGQMSQQTRMKEYHVEVYGSERFENYKTWLEGYVKQEASAKSVDSLVIVGGVSRTVVNTIDEDESLVGAGYSVGWTDNQNTDGRSTYVTTGRVPPYFSAK